MLAVSELSEALEADRAGGGQSEKIPEFSKIEEELADAVIRILDASASLRLGVPRAIIAKILYNKHRPKLHGKRY